MLGNSLSIPDIAVLGEGSAGSGMPAPPPGFHWEFVTSRSVQVTEAGINVVALAPNGG